jgi:hypothetical protein
MARGTVTLFEEFVAQLGSENHILTAGGDTIKVGLIKGVGETGGIDPEKEDETPTWADYVSAQVATTNVNGDYINGGVTLSGQTYTEVGGVAKFDDTGNISIAQDGSGFTDAYWGIIYNDTNATDMAIGFVDLAGPVSQVAGPVTINWNAAGIFTLTITS